MVPLVCSAEPGLQRDPWDADAAALLRHAELRADGRRGTESVAQVDRAECRAEPHKGVVDLRPHVRCAVQASYLHVVEDVGNDEARQSDVRGGGLGALLDLGDEAVGGTEDAHAPRLADGQLELRTVRRVG